MFPAGQCTDIPKLSFRNLEIRTIPIAKDRTLNMSGFKLAASKDNFAVIIN